MDMFRLSLRYMLLQKRRTVLTVVGVILAVALLSGIGILITSFLNMRMTEKAKEDGAWHYCVSVDTDYSRAAVLKSNVLIQRAGLSASDTYLQVEKQNTGKGQPKPADFNYIRLNEFEPAALSMMPYTITEGRMPRSSDEIAFVQGTAALFPGGVKLNDRITLPVGKAHSADSDQTADRGLPVLYEGEHTFNSTETRTFTVVGFYDNGIESWQNSGSDAVTLNPTGTHQYAIYVQMKPGINFTASIHKAVKDSGLGSAKIRENGIVEWMGESTSSRVRNAVIITFLILAAIILSVMALVIRNAFAMSVSEKIEQIGTLRCLGASPGHIRNLVLSEALCIWIAALPVGLLCGLGAMAGVIIVVRHINPDELAYLRLSSSLWPYILATVLSLAAVLLSARKPIRSTMKLPMVEAMRGNAIYRSGFSRKSRKGQLLGRLLGFSGLLASKNVRRNPRQFRTTLFSVIGSVVLFIAVGGFAISIGTSLKQAIYLSGSMDYEFTADSSTGNSVQELGALEQQVRRLKTVSYVQRTPAYDVTLNVPLARVPSNYPRIFKEFMGVSTGFAKQGKISQQVKILEVSRENYGTLRFAGKAPTYDELLTSKGALFCQTETFFSAGGRTATVEFANYKPGDTITVSQEYSPAAKKADAKTRDHQIKIVGLLSTQPWYAYNADGFLVMAQGDTADFATIFNNSKTGDTDDIGVGGGLFLDIRYAKGAERAADAQMQKLSIVASNAGVGYNQAYQDNHEMLKDRLIMEIFVYGFMVIIILISCITIFNTIHANLQVRRREIAMTRAVGMDQQQLGKMLLLECAIYGLMGTFWGSAIGIPLQLLLLKTFGHIILADMQSPLLLVLISLLASVGIGILAGYSSIRRMVRSSIVDEIRAE